MMPVKREERKKAKAASVPKDYDYGTDTVYTSFEGLKAGKVLKMFKPGRYAVRLLFALPESVLIAALIYYFIGSAHPIGIAPGIAAIIAFYALDSILGGVTSLGKLSGIKRAGKAGLGALMLMASVSLQPMTYAMAAVTLYFIKLADVYLALISGIITVIFYLVTMRFGFSPIILASGDAKRRTDAMNLSLQYFGGSFMSLFGLNALSLAVPVIWALLLATYHSAYALAAELVFIAIFLPLWEEFSASSFAILHKNKKVSYVVN